MSKKQQSKEAIRLKIQIQTSASITDFQYNHNGTQLAVADSQGNVFIYQKSGESFVKNNEFKADEAAIWKISWADPSFGETLGIGTFKRKVSVYQLKKTVWTEVAWHQIHESSVNHVEWAQPIYGLQLFAAGSDGLVSVLQLKKNGWASSSFTAHENSIHSLSLRPLSLNEDVDDKSESYPLLVTAGKDLLVKIWRHSSQVTFGYVLVTTFRPHKDVIRSVLWKKRWAEVEPIEYQILTCSQDGSVKLTKFIEDKEVEGYTICQFEDPIYRISQSVTGNLLSVSVAATEQRTCLYAERELDEWVLTESIH